MTFSALVSKADKVMYTMQIFLLVTIGGHTEIQTQIAGFKVLSARVPNVSLSGFLWWTIEMIVLN